MPIILKENECVHCKTQEEFKKVVKHINPKEGTYNYWNLYKKETCVRNNYGFFQYCSLVYYKQLNYKIYSFKEFMNVKEEKTYTQKEVDAIIAETRQKTIDEIIKRLETINSMDSLVTVNNQSTSRCKTCGKFKSKSGKCKSCKK